MRTPGPTLLLAENDHSIAARISDCVVITISQVSDQMRFIYSDCSLAIIADVRVVMNVAAVIDHIQIILKRNAVAAVEINGAGADIGPV